MAEYDDTSWRGRMVGSRMVKRAAKRGKKHRLDTTQTRVAGLARDLGHHSAF